MELQQDGDLAFHSGLVKCRNKLNICLSKELEGPGLNTESIKNAYLNSNKICTAEVFHHKIN